MGDTNSNESRKTLAITAANVAAVLVAAFALLSVGQKAAMQGLTAHGQIVTAQDAGAADAVAAVVVAPGTVGQVLTMGDGGLPVWRAAAGGGATVGTGTYAARPATCAEGDSYRVTSGKRLGSAYACTAANTWALSRIAYPGSVRPLYRYDGESLEGRASVVAWPDLENGNTLTSAGNRAGSVTVDTNATSGLPVAVWGSTSGALRASPGPLQARARSLLLVVYSADTTGTRILAGWGGTTSGIGWWLGTSTTSILLWVGGGVTWTGGTTPSTTTPVAILATYTGTHVAVATATLATSPSWSTAVASSASTLTTSGILGGTYVPSLIIGADDSATFATDPWQGTLIWAGVYDSDVTASRDGIVSDLATREGL